MEGNFKEASDENATLNSQISKLRSKIKETRAKQDEADKHNLALEDKAKKAREQAKGRINALMRELNMAEGKLGQEGKEKTQLSSQKKKHLQKKRDSEMGRAEKKTLL